MQEPSLKSTDLFFHLLGRIFHKMIISCAGRDVGKWVLPLMAGEGINDVVFGKITWQKLLRFKMCVLLDRTVLLSEACKQKDQGFPGGASGKGPPANAGDIRDMGGEDPLEEGMAPHSSILASRIPWTEAPGRLQPTVSQRVGHS